MSKPKVIAIVGPTASGKSALGIFLAQKLGGEIISADSRQVYRGLDIATGKVTKKEMAGIPHHLLNVASPKRQFSVDDFVKKAQNVIEKSMIYHTFPIVVGGTGLYIDMLLGRMTMPNVAPNPALRARLEKKSAEELLSILKKLDLRRAGTIEPGHKRRIIRAIEIAKAIGKSPLPKPEQKYDVLWLGLAPDEKKLKKNIHLRTIRRMKAGMVMEAKRLHKAGVSYKRMHELGLEYRSLAQYLQGLLNKEALVAEIERGNWDYAKRQMRWFKRNKDIIWIGNKAKAMRLAKKFLSGHK
ncbi:MAG TPA: tRNA (adenosine(37)-N6)-dimethylallyltransferase MiaA [Candidatus Paceibacterota bacterium]|nr:tRNA (adenosine(37)-N6)-dimethylallyltransferase MiaA [Candidatus Paceibacterota bacterium]